MAARTCTGVAVVGRKKDPPITSFSQWTKYSTPLRVSTRMLSGTASFTGFGLDIGRVFALRKRRLVDANYVSIKDVAAYRNTTKPTYGSCADTCWV